MSDVDLRTLGPQLFDLIQPFTETQNSVKSRAAAAPPGSPATGDRYIIAASPTGLWAGHAKDIARWDGAGWQFQTPTQGFSVWVDDESRPCSYSGSAWGVAHGEQTDVSLHALATYAGHGFMSSAHARKLALIVHIADFAPSNVALDNTNFEAAFRAAWTWAMAQAYPPAILLPAGTWSFAAAWSTIGKGTGDNPMPSLIGPGSGLCTLEFPTHLTGPAMLVDGYGDGLSDHNACYMRFQGFRIRFAGDSGTGICLQLQHTIMCELSDIVLWGAADGDAYTGGVGLYLRGNEDGLQNNQNLTLTKVKVQSCRTSLRLQGSGPVHAYDFISNQASYADIIVDGGSEYTQHSGMLQSGLDAGAGWAYHGDPTYMIRTVGMKMAGQTGSGAALSAPSGGLVTVTGLTGMTAASVGHYLQLSNAPAATPTNPNNGVYRIESYISATSVTIKKATGTAGTGLTWQERRYEGGSWIDIEGQTYHEGPITAGAKLETAASWDSWTLRGLDPAEMAMIVDATGTTLLRLENMNGSPTSGVWLKARNCQNIAIDNGPDPVKYPNSYDLDAFSRAGLNVSGLRGRGMYAGSRAGGGSLLQRLAPYAREVWDAGWGVSLVGGAVQTWTGVLNGSVLTAPAAGQRPLFMGRHPDLGGAPAVCIRRAGARTMYGPLATAIAAGTVGYGLLIVACIPRGSSLDWVKRGPSLYGAGGDYRILRCYDADGSGVGGFYREDSGNFLGASSVTPPAYQPFASLWQMRQDTDDPAGVSQVCVTYYPGGSVSNGNSAYHAPLATALTSLVLASDPPDHGNSNDLDYTMIVALDKPMPDDVVTDIMRELVERRVKRVPIRPVSANTLSGTVALIGLNQTLKCDTSSADCTVQLPAGHQSGDYCELIPTSSSHNLIIDPDGSETIDGIATLTLNAAVYIVSDGANWFTSSRQPLIGSGLATTLGPTTVDCILETPTLLTGTGSVNVDTSTKNDFLIVLGGSTTLNFTAFAAGRQGNIMVKQDGTGSRSLAWTVAGASSPTGFTLVKDTSLSDLNPQTAANSVTVYSYAMFALGGTNYLQLSKSLLG